jgi:broad specificity phosphatase PhoE
MNIYIFRHSESTDNKKGSFSGRSDVKITTYGRKKVQQIAQKLKDKKIDLAFTSPLSRTKDCLDYILEYHPETKVIIDKRLIERDYGKLTGKNKLEYARKHPKLFPIYHRSYDVPPPGGESMKQVDKRVSSFIKDVLRIIKKKKIETVVIVAHGNSIRPIRKYFERLSNEEMMKIETKKGEMIKYSVSI